MIDFGPPFARLSVAHELQRLADIDVCKLASDAPCEGSPPEEFAAHMRKTSDTLRDACQRLDIEVAPPHTPSRLLDKLISSLIESRIVQPTFLIDHPVAIS